MVISKKKKRFWCLSSCEEEEAGVDDVSNTNIYLNISGDGIEQSDDGADQ
jgi:hypothetical protein